MGRLTETDKCGNWGLKEIPWENLLVGTPITWVPQADAGYIKKATQE